MLEICSRVVRGGFFVRRCFSVYPCVEAWSSSVYTHARGVRVCVIHLQDSLAEEWRACASGLKGRPLKELKEEVALRFKDLHNLAMHCSVV